MDWNPGLVSYQWQESSENSEAFPHNLSKPSFEVAEDICMDQGWSKMASWVWGHQQYKVISFDKKFCQTQHPEVMEMLDFWVFKAMGDNILLTGKVLHQKWKQFTDLVGIPDDECLKLSEGWLQKFKLWNGLKEMKQHREAASAASEIVEKE